MSEAANSTFWFASEFEACVHRYRYAAGHLDSLAHTHDEYNFLFCLLGPLRYELRGRLWEMTAGDVLVINPGEPHQPLPGRDAEGARGLTIHLSVRELNRLVERMRLPVATDANRVLFQEQIRVPELAPSLEELESEIDSRRSGSDLLAQSLLVQILVLLLRRALTPRILLGGFRIPKQLPSWQLVRALEYMNSRGKSEFSLPELCAEARSSVSRFIPLFKNSCGDASPTAFHSSLLVRKAERLLDLTACPVKEISFLLGFQNESHFCRTFRQATGDTPGAWRSRRRGMI